MVVTLHWRRLGERGSQWNDAKTLYAMYHRASGQSLYIGKACRQTVSQRLSCASKDPLWEYLDEKLQLQRREVGLIVADVITSARRTIELLSDVESLLIKRLQPLGNIQSRVSRIERPGLVVECCGAWREARAKFHDR